MMQTFRSHSHRKSLQDEYCQNMKGATKSHYRLVQRNAVKRFWQKKQIVRSSFNELQWLWLINCMFNWFLVFIKVYADKEEHKKVGIFDRLEQTKTSSTQRIQITGLNDLPSTSASIFSRLGGKSDDFECDDARAVAFAGILKSGPKKVRYNEPKKMLNLVGNL